jgi:hypothetical protein
VVLIGRNLTRACTRPARKAKARRAGDAPDVRRTERIDKAMVSKKPALALLVILTLSFSKDALAQKRTISHGNSSPNTMGLYRPNALKSLAALSEEVRLKVDRHLRERFGNDYYSKLVFIAGASVDLAELYRVEPNARNWKWRIYTYELVFKYSDRKKGLDKYYARIKLDSNGSVLKEIDLPEVSREPHKANIISVNEAIEIAEKRGFHSKSVDIDMKYDEDAGSLTWTLYSFAHQDRFTATRRVIKIDAHSSAVLNDSYESGIK